MYNTFTSNKTNYDEVLDSKSYDQVYKYASLQVCKYAIMQVCKYTSMQACKYAVLQH